MHSKQKSWFNGYYLIIILLCLLVGLLIWFMFQSALKDLERQKEESYKKKLSAFAAQPGFPTHRLNIE